MDFVTQLWVPILASAVITWVLSAICWMALPHHRGDMDKIPNEQEFLAALKPLGIGPGSYQFPRCASHSDANKPEIQEAWKAGLSGTMVLFRYPMSMGKNMFLTFLVFLAVSTLIGYLGWTVLPHTKAEAPFGKVMQALGTAGVLAYCFSFLPNGIWFGAKPRAQAMCMVDGLMYGLATAAVFAWLWPK